MKNNTNRKTDKPTEIKNPASSRDRIETRAYELWIASGGAHGADLQHWLQAEAEIQKKTEEQAPGSGSKE